MKILVVGGGGREHALVWRLARGGHTVFAAPGNPGMARDAECIDVGAEDVDGQIAAAKARGVDLVVVGPEAPLVAGLADRLRDEGIAVFGPGADGAQLEGSKIYAKRFFEACGIRTAAFRECTSVEQADAAIDELGDRVVVKADGLAAGKGVVVCSSADHARAAAREMLVDKKFGASGDALVVEQRLEGRELSVMAITDGQRYAVLEQAEDHKAVFDGDQGPNTGGMGTVSPAAWASDELIARVRAEVFDPTIRGLKEAGIDYRGVLYAGLMIADDGAPWIIEYNCRFGDPEAESVMARFSGDLGEWLAGAAAGALPHGDMQWDPRTAVCVILASEGYPESPIKGRAIAGADAFDDADDVVVFHAGTNVVDGRLVASGGRVLGVTALADGTDAARARAYAAIEHIHFEGMHYRRDIGARGKV